MKLIINSVLFFILILTVGCGAGSESGLTDLGFEGESHELSQDSILEGIENPDNSDSGSIDDSGQDEGTVITPTLVNPGNVVFIAEEPSPKPIEIENLDVSATFEPEEEPIELDDLYVSATYEPQGEPIESDDLYVSVTYESDKHLDKYNLDRQAYPVAKDPEQGEDNTGDDD